MVQGVAPSEVWKLGKLIGYFEKESDPSQGKNNVIPADKEFSLSL